VRKSYRTSFCFGYEDDLNNAYAFYCARYENITFQEFLNLGQSDFLRKFTSIPESEPLYTIIKSRIINLDQIKDKQDKKYWSELKRVNAIPQEYLGLDERMNELMKFTKEKKL
jgi:hypothetical protein